MGNNKLKTKDLPSSVFCDEKRNRIKRDIIEKAGSRPVAVFEGGRPIKLFDTARECAEEYPTVMMWIPCMYMGKTFVWFDELPPVTKLAVVAFEDTLKNKAKQ